MQDLIVGGRYSVKHPTGYWAGEVTLVGIENGFNITDVHVHTGGEDVHSYFKRHNPATLNLGSEWTWELVNINLENE